MFTDGMFTGISVLDDKYPVINKIPSIKEIPNISMQKLQKGNKMLELKLQNRPDDALKSIQNTIIKRVVSKYSDVTPEFLILERKQLILDAEQLENKIIVFDTKKKEIRAYRADRMKQWEILITKVTSLFSKSEIDIINVDFPVTTRGKTFTHKLSTLSHNDILFQNKRMPQLPNETKLDDMIENKYEIELSLEVIKVEINKKAELYREMQKISQEVA